MIFYLAAGGDAVITQFRTALNFSKKGHVMRLAARCVCAFAACLAAVTIA
jgi:hypothetical protein